MKDFVIALLLFVMLSSSTALAAPQESATNANRQAKATKEDLRNKERKVRQLAEQLLDGRQLAVRVYEDWQADPAAYKLVSVPLGGLKVPFSVIESAFGHMSDSTVIAALGEDQKDEVVATVMKDFVIARAYRPTQWKVLHIWPPLSRDPGHKWWTFLDALGNPIPNAAVEMRILDWDCNAWIVLGKTTLDENGQLKRLILGSSLSDFIFVVSHPDYGAAKVRLRPSSSPDYPAGTHFVPLVPIDSEAGDRAIWGFVTDRQDRPVVAAEITCSRAGGHRPFYEIGGIYTALTDERGWFAMYVPLEKDGRLMNTLIPPMAEYRLKVTPPKYLNLQQYEGRLTTGKQATIILPAMRTDEYFHTFAFEYFEGPITDPEELKRISLELYRDGRSWLNLKYDDFKNGCNLPSGYLRAHTSRWHYHFSFMPVEVIPDSPEQLVFRPAEPIIYRGKVINADTAEPVPGVPVLIDHSYARKDPNSLTPQQWDQLYKQATPDSAGRFSIHPDKEAYDYTDRVTLTDQDGCYEVLFMPGFSDRLHRFTALVKGFVAKPVDADYVKLNADRIAELPPIRLSLPKPKPTYFPTLVFQDESGPVTDPNMLKHVRLTIHQPGIVRSGRTYRAWVERKHFTPAIYSATADWNGKYYVFESVDLTEQRPATVVFKIKEVKETDIVYQGQVIHGITGEPMPGTVVMSRGRPYVGDVSCLTPEQWDAIRSIGPEFEPDDLALAPLKEIFRYSRIARTDATGRFKIAIGPVDATRLDSFAAVEKDYLGAQQRLSYFVPAAENEPNYLGFKKEEFRPDEKGYVKLPPMRLFPAATVTIEPNIPGLGRPKKGSIRFYWFTSPDDTTPWLADLCGTPGDSRGASTFYKYEINPNEIQTLYIPAGLELTLKICTTGKSNWGSVIIPAIKLEQGQILHLGCVNLPPTIKVAAKVVDSQGKPLEGITVRHYDERGWYTGQKAVTNESGIAFLHVSPYLAGRFLVARDDREASKGPNEWTPYEVAGPEDTDKQFTLQLSDEILDHILK